MIKVDIVNEVSKVADITKVKAEVAVDAVFDAMRLSMQRGERIELRGFGVFQVKPRKRGIGRNPRTGKEVRIPPGRTIRFKPGKDLQNIGSLGPHAVLRLAATPEIPGSDLAARAAVRSDHCVHRHLGLDLGDVGDPRHLVDDVNLDHA